MPEIIFLMGNIIQQDIGIYINIMLKKVMLLKLLLFVQKLVLAVQTVHTSSLMTTLQ